MEAIESGETTTNQETSRPKRIIKKFLLVAFGSLLLLIALVLLYVGLGIGLGRIPTEARVIAEAKDQTIYIETNGVHVDFVIPNEYLQGDPVLAALIQPYSTFTAIGWGDKALYLETPEWKDLTVLNATRAMFWKSDSLLHVSPYVLQEERWIPVHLSEGQVEALMPFIRARFVEKEKAPILIPDASYFGYDQFYEAHGSYTLLYTCNHWVNEGLSEIGEATALWSPFDKPILEHAARNRVAYEKAIKEAE